MAQFEYVTEGYGEATVTMRLTVTVTKCRILPWEDRMNSKRSQQVMATDRRGTCLLFCAHAFFF